MPPPSSVGIECYTSEHNAIRLLAMIAVLLYPVGLLVLNGTLLMAARSAILAEKPSQLSIAVSFLHREFEPYTFWCV